MCHRRGRPSDERSLDGNLVGSHLSATVGQSGAHATGALVTKQSNDQ
jgi:hypothetical protein